MFTFKHWIIINSKEKTRRKKKAGAKRNRIAAPTEASPNAFYSSDDSESSDECSELLILNY